MGLIKFTDFLDQWDVFYSTVALASVTLAGLLFVSLSIRQERNQGQAYQESVSLARSSFGDFLYVLMMSLVFLVPHPVPGGLAIALFVLGLARGVGIGRQVIRIIRSSSADRMDIPIFRGILLPSIASIGLLVVGIGVLRGNYYTMYGLVIVVAALLTTASWNAWLILVAGEEDTLEG